LTQRCFEIKKGPFERKAHERGISIGKKKGFNFSEIGGKEGVIVCSGNIVPTKKPPPEGDRRSACPSAMRIRKSSLLLRTKREGEKTQCVEKTREGGGATKKMREFLCAGGVFFSERGLYGSSSL